MTRRDPGLQPERTALAWQRTALAAAVAAVLLVRGGVTGHAPLETAAGILAAAVALPAALPARLPPTTAATRGRVLAVACAVGGAGLLLAAQLLTGAG
ncbi:hypothetical protein GCM10027168_25140 [Streptomyces capparidis]